MTPGDVTIDTIQFYTYDLFSGNIYTSDSKPYRPYNISKEDIGKYFYISGYDINSYHSFFKIKVKDVGSTYIKVKVKNDTTIIIKNGAHETTYTVTSYSIKK